MIRRLGLVCVGMAFANQGYGKIELGAYLEVDLKRGTETTNAGTSGAEDVSSSMNEMDFWGNLDIKGEKTENGYTMGLSIQPTFSGDDVGLDNAMVSITRSSLYVQAGRFESMSTHSKGMDQALVDAGTKFYQGKDARGFDATKLVFGYKMKTITAELGIAHDIAKDKFSTTTTEGTTTTTTTSDANMLGIRPAVKATFGPINARLAIESISYTDQADKGKETEDLAGNALMVEYDSSIATASASIASATVTGKDASEADKNEMAYSTMSICATLKGKALGGDVGLCSHPISSSQCNTAIKSYLVRCSPVKTSHWS